MKDINCWESKFKICLYSQRLLDKITLLNEVVVNKVDLLEVQKAIYYARKYHGNQMRKSGEAYYSHPIEVAYMLAEYTAIKNSRYYRTDLIVTAILHDVIEDTELTEENIADIFNSQIADQVSDLTRVKFDKKITAADTVSELFMQHKDNILHIKLFDRLHNMRTIEAMSSEKITKIVYETINHFIPLAIHLEARDIEQELWEICHKCSNKLKTSSQKNSISFGGNSQLLSLAL